MVTGYGHQIGDYLYISLLIFLISSGLNWWDDLGLGWGLGGAIGAYSRSYLKQLLKKNLTLFEHNHPINIIWRVAKRNSDRYVLPVCHFCRQEFLELGQLPVMVTNKAVLPNAIFAKYLPLQMIEIGQKVYCLEYILPWRSKLFPTHFDPQRLPVYSYGGETGMERLIFPRDFKVWVSPMGTPVGLSESKMWLKDTSYTWC